MTEQPKGGLGRGLSALLPKAGAEASTPEPTDLAIDRAPGAPVLLEIPIGLIAPNPRQPRTVFDDQAIAELSASIRVVGLLQPIVVRRAGASYQIVAGERRFRASRLAGLTQIPAIVRDVGDEHLLRDALIENLQRVDLNPLEEAAALRQLVDDFAATHEEIAERIGKSRAAVTNALRLLALAPEVQARLASGILAAAHGRAIAALADHGQQARAAARVAAEGLSVRATEELVRQMAGSGVVLRDRAIASRTPTERPAGVLQAESMLSDILATRVKVEQGRRRGRIVIEFAGAEDLDRIVHQLQAQRTNPEPVEG